MGDPDVSYRLEIDETVTAGVRRVAAEQLGKALEDLGDEDRHEAVHEYRKRMKKLRALVRLVRPALGERYSAENRWFRDAARELSDLRDATSILETLDELEEQCEGELDDDAVRSVRDALERDRRRIVREQDLESRLRTGQDAAEAALARLDAWELDADGFEAVAGGVRKTYGRARRGLARARSERTTEAFHEWRKRVKYHRYHLRLLRDLWPEAIDPWRDELHRLSDLLGDDHDLAVLRGRITADGDELGEAPARGALLGRIEARRAELQARALPLGEKLFAEKPKSLRSRLRAMWEARREEAGITSAPPRT